MGHWPSPRASWSPSLATRRFHSRPNVTQSPKCLGSVGFSRYPSCNTSLFYPNVTRKAFGHNYSSRTAGPRALKMVFYPQVPSMHLSLWLSTYSCHVYLAFSVYTDTPNARFYCFTKTKVASQKHSANYKNWKPQTSAKAARLILGTIEHWPYRNGENSLASFSSSILLLTSTQLIASRTPNRSRNFYQNMSTAFHSVARLLYGRRSKSMGNGNFGVSELCNPWTDWLKLWHTWLRWWADLVCQIP